MHSPSKKREIGLLVQACRWVGLQPYWPVGCRMCRVPQARSSSRPMPMPAAELLLGLPSHAANVILTSQQLQPSGPRLPPQRATDPQEKGFSKTMNGSHFFIWSKKQSIETNCHFLSSASEIRECFHINWSFYMQENLCQFF